MLGRHDLLIIRRRATARTTNSWHGFGVYPNLAKDLVVSAPHQLWVSDITYIRTLQGFVYLSLLMDAFSRTIVGYDSSNSLEMEGALRALTMAQAQLPEGSRPMHHSDRGSQYCCGLYVQQLKARSMSISMTQENHCYENARAERLNGILKQEYGLGGHLCQGERGRDRGAGSGGVIQPLSPARGVGQPIPDAGAHDRGSLIFSFRWPGVPPATETKRLEKGMKSARSSDNF